jgi:hypothetical protein
MDVSGIALQGLEQAQVQFDRAAQRVAAQPTGDAVSLSEEAVALLTAKSQFEANLGVMKMADRIDRIAINLLG